MRTIEAYHRATENESSATTVDVSSDVQTRTQVASKQRGLPVQSNREETILPQPTFSVSTRSADNEEFPTSHCVPFVPICSRQETKLKH